VDDVVAPSAWRRGAEGGSAPRGAQRARRVNAGERRERLDGRRETLFIRALAARRRPERAWIARDTEIPLPRAIPAINRSSQRTRAGDTPSSAATRSTVGTGVEITVRPTIEWDSLDAIGVNPGSGPTDLSRTPRRRN